LMVADVAALEQSVREAVLQGFQADLDSQARSRGLGAMPVG
jgi:hypothetical protein